MKLKWWSGFQNEIVGLEMKFHTIYYKIKLHYYILSYIFIDFLYNLWYNKRGSISIRMGSSSISVLPIGSSAPRFARSGSK